MLAGYSPTGFELILRSFIALGAVHLSAAPAPKAITVRIDQIRAEIDEMHWEQLTRTRPLRLPLAG